MVTLLAASGAWGQVLAEKPLLDRLDPDTRARVLGALAGLILLGFLLVALVWLGGRVTRRYMRRGAKRPPASEISRDDWAARPLEGETPEDSEPDAKP